ncbi:lytic transglycosylase domain-containing protein [Paucibacter soli]|uniref:lytic transglycosylase domain-containing protein n=1 Tax=Paucibacter soli TaxID=3133433 RepID=UPI00309E425A
MMKTEGGRVGQFSLNSDGSYDMGPMQINTIHLKELSALYGITSPAMAQLLAYDGCFNVAVGAFLLRKRTNEAGGDFWYGIGRYHNKRSDLSARYILKVHQQMQSIVLDPRSARQ